MSKTEGVKVEPIGAEEYILICKKVADKLRNIPGIWDDATTQSFILITDSVYDKFRKEPIDETLESIDTEPIIDGGPEAGVANDTRT